MYQTKYAIKTKNGLYKQRGVVGPDGKTSDPKVMEFSSMTSAELFASSLIGMIGEGIDYEIVAVK